MSNRDSFRKAIQSTQAKPISPFQIPVTLYPTQQAFVDDDRMELFFGGAAGGGKSVALLASALKYVHVPGYAALLVRRSFTHLNQPAGLIPTSREWLNGRASYNTTTATWRFESNATLSFGYLDSDNDLDRYQGGEYQYVGVDEAGQIPEHRLRYLFSRLRKPESLEVPLRMRFASNPGGPSHKFLKQRYLLEETNDRRFIRSLLEDNPSLDRARYIQSLQQLDPLTRQRLLDGDWDAMIEGEFFRREWFQTVGAHAVPSGTNFTRFWDRAATAPKPGTDPDYTVGALIGVSDGVYFVRDIQRFRASPQGNETRIAQCARADGSFVPIRMEQEPGSSGKDVIDYYARHVLRGYDFKGVRSTGNKMERAGPVASAAELGNVKLVEGPWISAFLDEYAAFPHGPHDDQVDAVSGGFALVHDRPFEFRPFRVLDA
ncbi:MAG: phage terminase large subunit [Myxococcota bacterium]